jgi:hypothetical protein
MGVRSNLFFHLIIIPLLLLQRGGCKASFDLKSSEIRNFNGRRRFLLIFSCARNLRRNMVEEYGLRVNTAKEVLSNLSLRNACPDKDEILHRYFPLINFSGLPKILFYFH